MLRRLAVDKATVSAVARELGRSWDTVNAIAVTATRELMLTTGPARPGCSTGLRGQRAQVVARARRRRRRVRHRDHRPHPRCHRPGARPAARPGPGRFAAAFSGWLPARDQAFRDRVEIVAMDGFGGYKNAATEALPEAVTVMDPFHVVALAGTSLTCAANASSRTPPRVVEAPG